MSNGIDKVTDCMKVHRTCSPKRVTLGVEMFQNFTTKLRTGSENESLLVSKFLTDVGIQPYLNLTVDWLGPFSKSRDDWFMDVSLYERKSS